MNELNGYMLGNPKHTYTVNDEGVYVARITCPYKNEEGLIRYKTYPVIIPEELAKNNLERIQDQHHVILVGFVVPMVMKINGEKVIRHFFKTTHFKDLPNTKKIKTKTQNQSYGFIPKRHRYNSDWFSK